MTRRGGGAQIYYPDEEEAGEGQWWSGSVAADMLEPEEAQAALGDPWACDGLWERFVVHWAEPPVSLFFTLSERGGSSNIQHLCALASLFLTPFMSEWLPHLLSEGDT